MTPVKREPVQCLSCGCCYTLRKLRRWPWRRKDRWRCDLCYATYEQV